MPSFNINNAPQMHDLNRFLSTINKYGSLAHACRFAVFITNPPVMSGSTENQDLVFLCEQAEIPGKTINAQEARYYGPNFKYPVQTMYTEITLNFIVRNEMWEKEYFDNWMWAINPTDRYDFIYKNQYATNIDIIQYSHGAKDGNTGSVPTYKVTLENAWPMAVEPMGLVWSEENFHRISVQFAYDHWTRIDFPEAQAFSLIETKNVTR